MAWPTGFTRAVLFIKTPEGDGFSEEYLAQDTDVSNPSTWAGGIATSRLTLLPEQYDLVWIRINHPHDARTLLPYTASPALGSHGTYTDSIEFQRSEVGGLIKFYTAGGRYATRIFRGVSDDSVFTDGTLNPATAWSTALDSFLTYLIATAKVGLINTKATSTLAAYTFAKYTATKVLRTSTRDTGRPFGLRRGRSAA